MGTGYGPQTGAGRHRDWQARHGVSRAATGAGRRGTGSHLEVTRGVEQQVAGLQVPVQHVGRVDVLETTQDLIQEVADVVVAQLLKSRQQSSVMTLGNIISE